MIMGNLKASGRTAKPYGLQDDGDDKLYGLQDNYQNSENRTKISIWLLVMIPLEASGQTAKPYGLQMMVTIKSMDIDFQTSREI